MRKIIGVFTVAILAAATAIGLTTSAGGQATTDPAAAAATAESHYRVLRTPQSPEDVFHSSNPEYAAAAEQIAKTSRLVAIDGDAQAYTFYNGDQALCLLYRDAKQGFGASGCGKPDGDHSPAVLVLKGPQTTTGLLVGMVPDGVTDVTATGPDGQTSPIEVSETGGFVYHGATPFTVRWAGVNGVENKVTATNVDVTKLKPVP